jgi:hypothetical protein
MVYIPIFGFIKIPPLLIRLYAIIKGESSKRFAEK